MRGGAGDPRRLLSERLAARLTSEGRRAFSSGGGLHWQVDVGNGQRTLTIHCIWYDQAVSGLVLGMNPANARRRLQEKPNAPYEGPEFVALLFEDGRTIAEGRTREEDAVSTCVQMWLADEPFDALVKHTPFVDAEPRALRERASRLPTALQRDVSTYEHALWVYAGRRACRISPDGSCAFHYEQAQLAVAARADLELCTTAWLLEGVPVAELTSRVSEAVVEPHAEWAERDPARWHWLHTLDRADDPADVLAPLASLVRRLAARTVPSSFFTFTSLWTLCFSASSHYPWVSADLPHVVRGSDGLYHVGRDPSDAPLELATIEDAVAAIEAALGACPIVPFFGTAVDVERATLAQELAKLGSALVPGLERRGPWSSVTVSSRGRTCHVADRRVVMDGERFTCADDAEVARRVVALLDT